MTTPVRKSNTWENQLAALAIRHLKEGRRIIFVSPSSERSRAAQGMVAKALPPHLVRRISLARGSEYLETTTSGKIHFVASNATAGRGLTADVLMLDEVSDEVAEEVAPCIAGSPVGQVHRWFKEA
ncbi:hypothetical protein SEA_NIEBRUSAYLOR_4 [Mycobacterium phage NiebruSaylor]|nr:hypothetical protein SEA_VORRPS_4 [Mycobacterium phage Vorrps]QFP97052.1 hypothetical protein SEA_KRILI_4 [Mycobacterium phage Krili]QOC59203.1 hypothetical protein SEA_NIEBRUSAYLOR_4 [Mycobacterium phage NiebruSaylor]QXO13376.1 hypothetical protein SEA_MURAI_4 [Mycobacterium phage Murai]UAW08355.1 hypothetical protein SEA_MORI_4 [Mycobacterium phage Mori]WNO28589.1 ASCE ATPase [Mycobacterium phage MadKillah]